MLKKIENFLIEKQGQENFYNDMIYICQGGSFISGTNDETSDLDFRSIVLLNEDYQIGLKKFNHDKLLSGDKKINLSLDLDIEIFSTQYFIESAYHGEMIPTEMMYVDNNFVFVKKEPFNMIMEHRELFLSKLTVKKYISFINGCFKRSMVPSENLKRSDKIERSVKYGFETKDAMNAIKCSRIIIEFLDSGEFHLLRKDKDELLSIKNGIWTKDYFIKEFEKLQIEINRKYHESSLQEKPDFDTINNFTKNYNKQVRQYLNIA